MATWTCQITLELGQTGEGINSAKEIDMTKENAFTNVWDCQNSKPEGIDNSHSDVDLTVLNTQEMDEDKAAEEKNQTLELDPAGEPHTNGNGDLTESSIFLNENFSVPSDVEDEVVSEPKFEKLTMDQPCPTTKSKGKTVPQPSVSKPVKLEEKKSVKKNKIDEFAAIAAEEERTTQSELELAKLRACIDLECAKVDREYRILKEKRWAEKDRMKMEAREKESQCKHELCMAMLSGVLQSWNLLSNKVTPHAHPFLPTPQVGGSSDTAWLPSRDDSNMFDRSWGDKGAGGDSYSALNFPSTPM
ncbi:hypothetical protein GYMLUDRAFT_63652 [Collybiopsis luxurians FD-317 M1]|uniref:Uncharacterized protein n=1 Tax=Collybiopsis luxurians FD-317 M1 TaxID=944289 RepID=A0A0D0C6P6_9AGAR|nr:hypothetical protein GYMLUDRAFT_63652 [Collybiopsis luxurians FD-317 M1]